MSEQKDKAKPKAQSPKVSRDTKMSADIVCGVIGGTGFLLLILGLFTVWSTGWGKDLFGPGATLVTVALTAWVASLSVIKWTQQRDQDRQAAEYRHREEVYEQVLSFMMDRITGGTYDKDLDKQLRSKAALWGSSGTIDSLGEWQVKLMEVMKSHPGQTEIDMTSEESVALRQQFARALLEMRKDLGSTDKNAITRTEILRSIFND